MTDDLINRLRDYDDVRGWNVRQEASDAIEALAKLIVELEEERGALIRDRTENLCALADAEARIAELEAECACDQRNAAVSQQESVMLLGRAEKAEADLSAARAAIRDAAADDVPVWTVWKRHHAPAIAAARGEKEKTDDLA